MNRQLQKKKSAPFPYEDQNLNPEALSKKTNKSQILITIVTYYHITREKHKLNLMSVKF